MNWDAISAISQLIGSVAVVLSVLYLALQVHRSTRVAKLATQDSAATALRDVTKPLMENAELERIWRVGSEDNVRRFHPAASRAALLTRSRHRDHEFAVLLGDEVFGAAG